MHGLILYRICQKADGEGSLLVFLPGLRWFLLFPLTYPVAALYLAYSKRSEKSATQSTGVAVPA